MSLRIRKFRSIVSFDKNRRGHQITTYSQSLGAERNSLPSLPNAEYKLPCICLPKKFTTKHGGNNKELIIKQTSGNRITTGQS